jgi:HCOMODA/2-hydroxy-3-carboxy-muconic semialdehyde decarboxylase
LLRNDEAAAGVAETLGDARAIVLRGNGVVVTGATIEETTAMVFYLEQGTKAVLAVLACSGHPDADPVIPTPEQAEARNAGAGRINERTWDYLTDSDPE